MNLVSNMPAKKNIIKALRKEILDLEVQIKDRDHEITHQKKMHKSTIQNHEFEMSRIDTQTNNIANSLKYRFSKELTWLELSDDPESKMQIIKGAIQDLQLIGYHRRKG